MARNILFDPMPSVAPTGPPDAYQRISAEPAAFGSLNAKAMEELGAGGLKLGEQALTIMTARQALDNEVHASEVNTWLANQISDRHAKYGVLEGRAAMDALPQYKTDLEDLYQQSMKQARSPAEQAALAKSGRYLTTRYMGWGTNHANSQWRSWADKTAVDRANTYGNQAMVAQSNGDDAAASVALNTSDDEVRKLFEQKGYDTEAITAEVAKNRGRNVLRMVEEAAADNPVRAQGLFRKYKDQMDAASQASAIGKLRNAHSLIVGRGVADEESGHVLPRSEPIGNVPSSFISAVKASEGYTGTAKWDVRQNSIGYGTRAKFAGETIDKDEAERRFGEEFGKAAKFVDTVNPNLDPGTRAALASLTFNAGEKWASSGLGEAVRAGDIVKAREAFLQYNKVDNGTGQLVTSPGLQARRYREASWFGAPEAPAGGQPLVDKTQAYERVLSRTDQNPLVQNAAIARLNQVYSIYHGREVQQNAAFDQRLKDETAMAYVTGNVPGNALTETEFVNRFGVEQGMTKWQEHLKNRQLGADIKTVAGMSPEEQRQVLARHEPQTGGAGYEAQGFEAQTQRYKAVHDAINRAAKEKEADPAQFALNHLPTVRASYQGLSQVLSDPQATPQMKQAAAAQYANVMLAEQSRVGVPDMDRKLVPKEYIAQLNAKMARPAAAGGTSTVADTIASEAQLWGGNWPLVEREINKTARPAVKVIASGIDPMAPMASRLLVDLEPLSAETILKDESKEKLPAVRDKVRDAVKPFARTLEGQDAGASTLHDFEGQILKLAAYYVGSGEMTPELAANRAFKEVIGHKYEFRGNLRIPKNLPDKPDELERGANAALKVLERYDIEVPIDRSGSLDRTYLRNAAVTGIKRNSQWVTASGDTGVWLIYKDQPVRLANGQPLFIPWTDLGYMAKSRDAEISPRLLPTAATDTHAAGWGTRPTEVDLAAIDAERERRLAEFERRRQGDVAQITRSSERLGGLASAEGAEKVRARTTEDDRQRQLAHLDRYEQTLKETAGARRKAFVESEMSRIARERDELKARAP